MVQMFIDPIFDEMKISKINHKSIIVQFLGFKSQGNGPAMPMQSRAPARMIGLAVGEGNVPVSLTACNHKTLEI